MKLVGSEAVKAYRQACPNDDLSHLSAEEMDEFEFEDVALETISIPWDRTLVYCGLAPSRTAARRLIEQDGVRVDGEKVTDFITTELVTVGETKKFILSAGKRQVRVVLADK